MQMERFVVLPSEGAWWVSLADRKQLSFASLQEAERCAFAAAEASAAAGNTVTVLIVPMAENLFGSLGRDHNHAPGPH